MINMKIIKTLSNYPMKIKKEIKSEEIRCMIYLNTIQKHNISDQI